MAEAGERTAADPPGDWDEVGIVLVDFANRKVSIRFDAAFYAEPVDERALIAKALIDVAVGFHVEMQDERVAELKAAEWPQNAEEAAR